MSSGGNVEVTETGLRSRISAEKLMPISIAALWCVKARRLPGAYTLRHDTPSRLKSLSQFKLEGT